MADSAARGAGTAGALDPLALPEPLARGVLAAINHVLAQNAWAARALAAHAGAGVRIRVRGPLGDVDASAFVRDDGMLEWRGEADAPFRVQLTASLSPALLPALMRDGTQALMRSVRVDGDAELAAVLAKVVQGARWDAEEDLSRVVGDIAARRLMGAAGEFARFTRDAARRAETSARGYLVEEDPQLVSSESMQAFRAEVRRLRDDTDRLEKRIELLERAQSGRRTGGGADTGLRSA